MVPEGGPETGGEGDITQMQYIRTNTGGRPKANPDDVRTPRCFRLTDETFKGCEEAKTFYAEQARLAGQDAPEWEDVMVKLLQGNGFLLPQPITTVRTFDHNAPPPSGRPPR